MSLNGLINTFDFGVLIFLHAKTDDFVSDGLLRRVQRVDMNEIHGEFEKVLTIFGVVHLLFEGSEWIGFIHLLL